MILGAEIAKQAETLIGSRWQRNGRGPIGYDCSGLVVCSARNAGLEIEDCSNYDVRCVPDGLIEDFCARNGTIGSPVERSPGTVFLMKADGSVGVSHMGIISTYDRVIHMDASKHRVVAESFAWLESRCAMTMKLHGVL